MVQEEEKVKSVKKKKKEKGKSKHEEAVQKYLDEDVGVTPTSILKATKKQAKNIQEYDEDDVEDFFA